ncbi:MAG: hypothetical protein Aurels2KO_20030 [Aureliella sp.]
MISMLWTFSPTLKAFSFHFSLNVDKQSSRHTLYAYYYETDAANSLTKLIGGVQREMSF